MSEKRNAKQVVDHDLRNHFTFLLLMQLMHSMPFRSAKSKMNFHTFLLLSLCLVLVLQLSCISGSNVPNDPFPTAMTPGGNESSRILGKIMFYFPIASKSIKMTFLPLAEALIDRGHFVSLIMPYEYDTKGRSNAEVITVDNVVEDLAEINSNRLLQNDIPINDIMKGALKVNNQAFESQSIKRYLAENATFDVVMTFGTFGEPGVYLAHKFNAAYIQYYSLQSSVPFMDRIMGQPNHPAYMPFYFSDLTSPMNLVQRVKNFFYINGFMMIIREFKILATMEAFLDEKFPDEKDSRCILDN